MKKLKFMGRMEVELKPSFRLGSKSKTVNVIMSASSGFFKGPKIEGRVFPNDRDWALEHSDGESAVEVRGLLQTNDNARITIGYPGRFVIPTRRIQNVIDGRQDGEIDMSELQIRATPYFRTSDPRYTWLNNTIAIGTATFGKRRAFYEFFEIA